MATLKQIQRRQNIRMAEGFLDLATVMDDQWPLNDELKKSLANRAIEKLESVKNPMGHKPYVLFLKGQACRTSNRPRRAIHFLEQSKKLDPDNLHTYLALAWCYKRTNQLPLAIESMQAAVELNSESAISHYNLACYCALQFDVNSALMHLTFALDLNPELRTHVSTDSDFDLIRKNPGFAIIAVVPADSYPQS
ncbi:MAG: tetratricopeptide (TPR) repeat protein [Mariniblastus sp.]|jgi:tetratricopeptide (TPR) repeat protein